jgi:serine/threonine protein kinase
VHRLVAYRGKRKLDSLKLAAYIEGLPAEEVVELLDPLDPPSTSPVTVLSPPATPEHFDAQKALALVCDRQCLTDHTNKAIDPLRLVDLQSMPWGQLEPNVVKFTHTVVKIPKKIVEEECATREMYEDKLRREIVRTLREVCMVAVLHPRILRPDAACTITMDGVPVYGLQYARQKEDLFAYIERKATSDDVLASFATDLISALAFLHEQEIYHLDLKPENVVVDRFARLQLIDFGFSHCDRWTVSHDVGHFKKHTCIGRLADTTELYFGTPPYLPHQELACRDDFLRCRDQWALGCTLYACAYGRMLYSNPTEDDRNYSFVRDYIKAPKTFLGDPPRFIEAILPDLISETPVSMQHLRETVWQEHADALQRNLTKRFEQMKATEPVYKGAVRRPLPLRRVPSFTGTPKDDGLLDP